MIDVRRRTAIGNGCEPPADRLVPLARMWLSTSYRPSGLLVLALLFLVLVIEVEHIEQVPDRRDVGRYVG